MQTNANLNFPVDQTALPSTLEFFAFNLGSEEYGIGIQKVQELRDCEAVTYVDNAPDWLKGVINLRGAIVPIVDLRVKFNLESTEYNGFTVVIIVSVAARVIGMVVDNVSDVITLKLDQVKPVPEVGSTADMAYMIGIVALEERMLILVDIGRLISDADMGTVARLAA